MPSVLQPWVMELGLRHQGTLLTAVRGCDLATKEWNSEGEVIDTPVRRLTAFVRYCFMVAADPREVDMPGAFFQSAPPFPFKVSAFGHFPMHWLSHVMHALQIIRFKHPDADVRRQASHCYRAIVHNLHLSPESEEHMDQRLNEDRIAAGTVAS